MKGDDIEVSNQVENFSPCAKSNERPLMFIKKRGRDDSLICLLEKLFITIFDINVFIIKTLNIICILT